MKGFSNWPREFLQTSQESFFKLVRRVSSEREVSETDEEEGGKEGQVEPPGEHLHSSLET